MGGFFWWLDIDSMAGYLLMAGYSQMAGNQWKGWKLVEWLDIFKWLEISEMAGFFWMAGN